MNSLPSINLYWLLKFLKNWNHDCVYLTMGIYTSMLDESSHGNQRRLKKIMTSSLEILTEWVFVKSCVDVLEERSQSVLLLRLWSWCTVLSKFLKNITALVRNGWLVHCSLNNVHNKLFNNLRIYKQIRMMLTYSTHNPTNCFSYLTIWILKHGHQVLESLNDNL